MNEEDFRAYIAEFNAANFAALARYYADDVVFSFNIRIQNGRVFHHPAISDRERGVAIRTSASSALSAPGPERVRGWLVS